METTSGEKKKIIYSGIQPTGILTLGNYIGALRNFPIHQDKYDCLYSIVDLHALTVRQNPAELRLSCMRTMAIYLAVGLNPDKSTIYFQSHVPMHAELAWILNCYVYMGELSRMTQFKEKSEKHSENVNAGLFTYPALMAADILLYQADMVPVGSDQKQHLEITRDIAQRFNGVYGNVFTVPDAYIDKIGGRVMSLSEPQKKMSKSDHEDSYVALLDTEAVIRRKFRRAVTDSENEVRFDPENKPGVSNLIAIISALSGRAAGDIASDLHGKGYGALKDAAADIVVDTLMPIQQKYEEIVKDKQYLQKTMTSGAERASALALRTMRKVRKKLGLAPFEPI